MDGNARPAYSMKSPERLIRRLPRPVHGPHHCACTSTTARQVGSASSTLVFQSTSLTSGVMNFCDIRCGTSAHTKKLEKRAELG